MDGEDPGPGGKVRRQLLADQYRIEKRREKSSDRARHLRITALRGINDDDPEWWAFGVFAALRLHDGAASAPHMAQSRPRQTLSPA